MTWSIGGHALLAIMWPVITMLMQHDLLLFLPQLSNQCDLLGHTQFLPQLAKQSGLLGHLQFLPQVSKQCDLLGQM